MHCAIAARVTRPRPPPPNLAQGARILSRPVRPGGHPLRALRTGAARPALPGREWAAVSCYADPVNAQMMAAYAMDAAAWQWAAVPSNFAQVVLESGALRHIRRVVELGAAHAGRCAAATGVCANGLRGAGRGALSDVPSALLPEQACQLGSTPRAAADSTLPSQRAGRGARRRSDRIWCVPPRRRVTAEQEARVAAELTRLTRAGAAACGAMAQFVADDVLRAVLLGVARERVALDAAVMRLASVTWDRAEAPGVYWVVGAHVSSRAPALAAVLLGDVESEDGAEGGVALSPSAVGAVVLGMASALSRPSSSGSYLWPVARALCHARGAYYVCTRVRSAQMDARGAHSSVPLVAAQAAFVRAVARGRGG